MHIPGQISTIIQDNPRETGMYFYPNFFTFPKITQIYEISVVQIYFLSPKRTLNFPQSHQVFSRKQKYFCPYKEDGNLKKIIFILQHIANLIIEHHFLPEERSFFLAQNWTNLCILFVLLHFSCLPRQKKILLFCSYFLFEYFKNVWILKARQHPKF